MNTPFKPAAISEFASQMGEMTTLSGHVTSNAHLKLSSLKRKHDEISTATRVHPNSTTDAYVDWPEKILSAQPAPEFALGRLPPLKKELQHRYSSNAMLGYPASEGNRRIREADRSVSSPVRMPIGSERLVPISPDIAQQPNSTYGPRAPKTTIRKRGLGNTKQQSRELDRFAFLGSAPGNDRIQVRTSSNSSRPGLLRQALTSINGERKSDGANTSSVRRLTPASSDVVSLATSWKSTTPLNPCQGCQDHGAHALESEALVQCASCYRRWHRRCAPIPSSQESAERASKGHAQLLGQVDWMCKKCSGLNRRPRNAPSSHVKSRDGAKHRYSDRTIMTSSDSASPEKKRKLEHAQASGEIIGVSKPIKNVIRVGTNPLRPGLQPITHNPPRNGEGSKDALETTSRLVAAAKTEPRTAESCRSTLSIKDSRNYSPSMASSSNLSIRDHFKALKASANSEIGNGQSKETHAGSEVDKPSETMTLPASKHAPDSAPAIHTRPSATAGVSAQSGNVPRSKSPPHERAVEGVVMNSIEAPLATGTLLDRHRAVSSAAINTGDADTIAEIADFAHAVLRSVTEDPVIAPSPVQQQLSSLASSREVCGDLQDTQRPDSVLANEHPSTVGGMLAAIQSDVDESTRSTHQRLVEAGLLEPIANPTRFFQFMKGGDSSETLARKAHIIRQISEHASSDRWFIELPPILQPHSRTAMSWSETTLNGILNLALLIQSEEHPSWMDVVKSLVEEVSRRIDRRQHSSMGITDDDLKRVESRLRLDVSQPVRHRGRPGNDVGTVELDTMKAQEASASNATTIRSDLEAEQLRKRRTSSPRPVSLNDKIPTGPQVVLIEPDLIPATPHEGDCITLHQQLDDTHPSTTSNDRHTVDNVHSTQETPHKPPTMNADTRQQPLAISKRHVQSVSAGLPNQSPISLGVEGGTAAVKRWHGPFQEDSQASHEVSQAVMTELPRLTISPILFQAAASPGSVGRQHDQDSSCSFQPAAVVVANADALSLVESHAAGREAEPAFGRRFTCRVCKRRKRSNVEIVSPICYACRLKNRSAAANQQPGKLPRRKRHGNMTDHRRPSSSESSSSHGTRNCQTSGTCLDRGMAQHDGSSSPLFMSQSDAETDSNKIPTKSSTPQVLHMETAKARSPALPRPDTPSAGLRASTAVRTSTTSTVSPKKPDDWLFKLIKGSPTQQPSSFQIPVDGPMIALQKPARGDSPSPSKRRRLEDSISLSEEQEVIHPPIQSLPGQHTSSENMDIDTPKRSHTQQEPGDLIMLPTITSTNYVTLTPSGLTSSTDVHAELASEYKELQQKAIDVSLQKYLEKLPLALPAAELESESEKVDKRAKLLEIKSRKTRKQNFGQPPSRSRLKQSLFPLGLPPAPLGQSPVEIGFSPYTAQGFNGYATAIAVSNSQGGDLADCEYPDFLFGAPRDMVMTLHNGQDLAWREKPTAGNEGTRKSARANIVCLTGKGT